jgi:hypothetical protein
VVVIITNVTVDFLASVVTLVIKVTNVPLVTFATMFTGITSVHSLLWLGECT